MDHKAFLLDYVPFDRELRPTLEGALLSGSLTGLEAFINLNVGKLRDPYQGEPLGSNWKAMLETHDAHQYGDFAMTKYYDPAADIGLGASWETVQDLISADSALTNSCILGNTIGPQDGPFDPGKMGSYFQSPEEVLQSHKYLLHLLGSENGADLENALHMLKEAVDAKTGLYITF